MSQFDRFGSSLLLKRMEALANVPKSKPFYTLRQKIEGRVVTGNRAGLLAGTDGQGQPLKPVQPRRGPYRGKTGPPLVPSGAKSRFIANFRTAWVLQSGVWHLLMGWEDILSKKGYPFVVAHLKGVPARNLPRRNVAGIRPRDRAAILGFFRDLLPDILKGSNT